MWIRWVSLAARLGLAGIWLVSGWLKASDPTQTTVAVGAYQLLSDDLVRPVANTLPFVEIGLGLFLLLGLGVRVVSAASAALLVVLIAAVASAWARGLSIDCGCFGGGGPAAGVTAWDYLREILRDVGFLCLAAWLMVFPRSPFALGPGSRPFDVEPEQTSQETLAQ
ncbi:DoxX family membrane protein [Aldersonia sp. NBC_00410]|uniref:MauE/DoxX family redox-associated membrane protein n=1 Tax=Aldersonia sp. NBC_00410 TaxID=2975954 RepID=UPI0022541012|nr:MauE/DoxX family redox-associated membrane protein [Aldersonia sp. NBC_00410]MCX5044700.1 DoxX family membrane protein [Aldersonia sp. NBC_00410]